MMEVMIFWSDVDVDCNLVTLVFLSWSALIKLICVFYWFVEGRKLCTGSRDNWMCLWDIESAKCEQRQNVSRNLVRKTVCAFVYITMYYELFQARWIPWGVYLNMTEEESNQKAIQSDCSSWLHALQALHFSIVLSPLARWLMFAGYQAAPL